MKRYLTAALFLITVALTFSGCFPTGEKPLTKYDSSEYKSGDKFEYSKENLTAEFTIPEKLPQATRIGVKLKDFDREKVIKLFFGDRAYTRGLDGDIRGSGADIYNTDDGALHLDFFVKRFIFYDKRVCDFRNDYPVDYAAIASDCKPGEWYHNPPSDKDLEDFPRETALKQAGELLAEIGFENLGEPETYTMSVDAIKNIQGMNEEDQKKLSRISKEHECYVFRYPIVFDGIEISDVPTRLGNIPFNSSKIEIVLTRESIVYFNANMPLDNSVEILSEEPVKYDFEYAINEFKRIHDAVYSDFNTTVYNFMPAYYPVSITEAGTLEFIPIWTFEGYGSRLEVFDEGSYINSKRYVVLVGSDDGILKTYEGV